MISDAAVLQHVYSGSPYRELVRLTFERHFAYCGRHHMDYHLVESDVAGWKPVVTGHWANLLLIDRLLTYYSLVFYVDADAVIWDPGVDLREAFEGRSEAILAAQHPGPPRHLNDGVFFFRQDERMQKFFDAWLDAFPGVPPWFEQTEFNRLANMEIFAGLVGRMDDRWNSTDGVNESPEPVIRAWHSGRGFEDKFRKMKQALGA